MSGISENCRLGFLQTVECIIRVRDSIEKRKGKPWWHWQKIWIRLTVPSALCGDACRYFWYPFPDVLDAFLLPWKDLGQAQMAFLWFSWASLYEIEIRWQGKTLVLKDCALCEATEEMSGPRLCAWYSDWCLAEEEKTALKLCSLEIEVCRSRRGTRGNQTTENAVPRLWYHHCVTKEESRSTGVGGK